MNRWEVRTTADALAYITDCTLATVYDMATKKSRVKSEYRRQKAIAQTTVDWMVQMRVDVGYTRAADVAAFGSVDAWAAQYEPKKG